MNIFIQQRNTAWRQFKLQEVIH